MSDRIGDYIHYHYKNYLKFGNGRDAQSRDNSSLNASYNAMKHELQGRITSLSEALHDKTYIENELTSILFPQNDVQGAISTEFFNKLSEQLNQENKTFDEKFAVIASLYQNRDVFNIDNKTGTVSAVTIGKNHQVKKTLARLKQIQLIAERQAQLGILSLGALTSIEAQISTLRNNLGSSSFRVGEANANLYNNILKATLANVIDNNSSFSKTLIGSAAEMVMTQSIPYIADKKIEECENKLLIPGAKFTGRTSGADTQTIKDFYQKKDFADFINYETIIKNVGQGNSQIKADLQFNFSVDENAITDQFSLKTSAGKWKSKIHLTSSAPFLNFFLGSSSSKYFLNHFLNSYSQYSNNSDLALRFCKELIVLQAFLGYQASQNGSVNAFLVIDRNLKAPKVRCLTGQDILSNVQQSLDIFRIDPKDGLSQIISFNKWHSVDGNKRTLSKEKANERIQDIIASLQTIKLSIDFYLGMAKAKNFLT